ncbi:hypothetical protein [Leadbetterella sp. DM7]|uniref:cytidylyltransferase domain-containing protein n=1 Tax=Leadbetterella sp. DM7 TaxID=3235085 RepID=UPI00349EC850
MFHNSSKLGIVLQARLGSSRLPAKILLPIDDEPLLFFIEKKFQYLNIPILFAITNSERDDELEAELRKRGAEFIRGSEKDVLSRFLLCAEKYSFNYIIRVCTDNPFINIFYLNELLKAFSNCNENVDYLSFSYKEKPVILSHFGIFAEIVSVSALKQVYSDFSGRGDYREHVTIGVYSNPDRFKVVLIPLDNELKKYEGLRLTIDTLEDYNNIIKIRRLRDFRDDMPFSEIGELILADNEIFESMRKIIETNKK